MTGAEVAMELIKVLLILAPAVALWLRADAKAKTAQKHVDAIIDGAEKAAEGGTAKDVKTSIRLTAESRGVESTLQKVVHKATKRHDRRPQ